MEEQAAGDRAGRRAAAARLSWLEEAGGPSEREGGKGQTALGAAPKQGRKREMGMDLEPGRGVGRVQVDRARRRRMVDDDGVFCP